MSCEIHNRNNQLSRGVTMTKPFKLAENGEEGFIFASKTFFSRETVLLVADDYAQKYFVSVFPSDENTVQITLRPKDELPLSEEVLREVMNHLIDCQVKIDLQKEFGDIRKKIVEYAFAPVER